MRNLRASGARSATDEGRSLVRRAVLPRHVIDDSLFQVADECNDPADQLGNAIHRRPVIIGQRRLHLQELQLGEQRRQWIGELVLRDRHHPLELGLWGCTVRRRRIARLLSHGVTVHSPGRYVNLTMIASPGDPTAEIAGAVEAYRESSNVAALLDRLAVIAEGADIDALIAAVEPYRELPEVSGPVYEYVVRARPNDARALVILANAYWLSGRGPDVVGELASRALAADPRNRGAWHLWALTESELRERVARWAQVAERFPDDELARANLADNAASLASTEHDPDALHLAIRSYESLLATAQRTEQRLALESALGTLRGWKV